MRKELFQADDMLPTQGKKSLPVLLIATIILVSFPQPIEAQFPDRSDELPGIVSDKSIFTSVAIAAGAVLAVILIVKKVKKPKVDLGFEPSQLKFPPTAVGEARSQQLRITNILSEAVIITQITVSGKGFSQGSGQYTEFPLAPGETSQISITFTPLSAKKHSGKLNVRAKAMSRKESAKWKISLKGRGIK